MSECSVGTRVGVTPPQIFLIGFAQIPQVVLETKGWFKHANPPWPRPCAKGLDPEYHTPGHDCERSLNTERRVQN